MSKRFLEAVGVLAASLVLALFCAAAGAAAGSVTISGELKRWHDVQLALTGPTASEDGSPNPFLDYRMTVVFSHPASGAVLVVPGYFAADGEAAESSASAGSVWRAHLSPAETGLWNYVVGFRSGAGVAVADGPSQADPDRSPPGAALAPYDGVTGSFVIAESDKSGRDFRAHGRLEYVGEHYLRFAGSGKWFLKQGPDAPENLLAYADFDGGFGADGQKDNLVKNWAPHLGDWQPGDPSWQGSRGRGLIGALNYLAAEGQNAFSFLTMNIGGDDRNVFPYTGYSERQRLDVSRLAQWEIIFGHADRLGLYLHFKTQETENETLLDGGALGTQRKLYYRELIARFAHHLALNWNLGEENSDQTTQQRKDMAGFFADHDPYGHHIVIHTYPGAKSAIYTPLLGSASALTGTSLQGNNSRFTDVHGDVLTWVANSAAAGRPWVVAVDEPGNASDGVVPDDDNDDSSAGNHRDARARALWGTLLAGGGGNEWYFGYQHADSDLTLQDFRSRDRWWDYTRAALSLFEDEAIPFWRMRADDALSSAAGSYVFRADDEIYLVYLPAGGTTMLDLGGASGEYEVRWFDPRNGGPLQPGTVTAVVGGGVVGLGQPPAAPGADWLALIRRSAIVGSGVDVPALPLAVTLMLAVALLTLGGVRSRH